MSKGKVCLAYSGGLDTSIILAWLLEQGYEVVAFLANIGQEEDFEAAREKALKIGATKFIVSDVRKEFVEEVLFPAVQVNAIYENVYLLGTSLARPVIAKAQIEVAEQEGCFAVAHGCTGKGNDQVRFELSFYALKPDVVCIAPWRDPEFFERFAGRNDLLNYAAEKDIPVAQTKAKPWSTDENMAHISFEAGILEDPNTTPPKDMWKLTVDPEDAPDKPEFFDVHFEKGKPVKLVLENKTEVTDPVEIFLTANAIARRNGVGRIDIVENRFIGIKSRGCYETPGLTLLRTTHIDLEGLTVDREVRSIRDTFVTPTYSKLLYNGLYFTPEGEYVRTMIQPSQNTVNGVVRAKAYKGNVYNLGRYSETEKLYDATESSMDELTGFHPQEAGGFITTQAIRIKKYGESVREKGKFLGL
ncbi:Argininosuccinate synthase [Komagataella phaffii CBS 7435]|uniref:Argininosuccinate synthase n=3 Tax=Komagataella TaxID=460517 RepID=C4R3W1_KOMPG|nr:Arginosuccinate synthetase [Komagataella phaffii GS115]AAT07966.1 arginino succinate synthase [Komagataella pastoris]AOA63218.1 GQ67_03260T0 [Komagataella phaffii]KAI0461828.1 argininosuccinate synthetase [Komagataella kurtzmanii]CAH2450012.1 Argininosuccinate synthase [Komagataella phaffii CBS 7435]AOA69051.1 GQ68_03229T0 [Komagataella phaffii GS115]